MQLREEKQQQQNQNGKPRQRESARARARERERERERESDSAFVYYIRDYMFEPNRGRVCEGKGGRGGGVNWIGKA